MAFYPSYGTEFQFRYEFSGSFILYEGFAQPTAKVTDLAWVIKKYGNDGTNVTQITMADASYAFDKAWSNRAEYSY